MSSVAELQNIFTREEYPPNERGQSDVPLSDIYADLIHRFPNGYTIKVVDSGVIGNQGYVLVEANLPLDGNQWLVVPGAAQGAIGMAGLLTMAIRNALLRHAGMGSSLYENDDENSQAFNNNGGQPGIPGSPFGQGDQHANYGPNGNGGGYPPAANGYQYQAPPPNQYNQNGNANGYQNNGGNRGGGNYGPWTGEVIIKSGQFQGLKWAQLPPDVLQNMAGKGNVLANKELARRNGSG